MAGTPETIAIGAAALLYMAKTVYELARGEAARRNGNGKSPGCSTEVLNILRRQTDILEALREKQGENSADMRELLTMRREGRD